MASSTSPAGIALQSLQSASDIPSLALLLGCSPRTFLYLLYGLTDGRRYHEFSIRKRSGANRKILTPIKPLKQVQRAFAALLDQIYQPRDCVYGYIHNRGIRQNAELHAGQRWLLRIDLKDFFPSIHFGRVRGMFLKKPFSLNSRIAQALATLTALKTELPQGAPTSPIISNLISQHLDGRLLKLAAIHRCYYSRYADDIIFSTSRRIFPRQLASLESSSGTLKTIVTEELRSAIQAEGFSLNDTKTILKGRTSRQMCTGLIVNQSPNVPRTYIREIRSMLHSWKRDGPDIAGKYFFANIDRRNRPASPNPDYRLVTRGRIQYVGSIKGWEDPVYRGLADKLAVLDETFRPKYLASNPFDETTPAAEIVIYAEGKTDYMHLTAALAYFQLKNLHKGVSLVIAPGKEIKGVNQLVDRCEILASESPQPRPTVFMFDRDVPKILPKVTDPIAAFKSWGRNVYSFAIPVPSHRSDAHICIEMLYIDADLALTDSEGRRLFLRREFNEKGFHESGKFICQNPKNEYLIVDEHVYETATQKSVALSKNAFAEYLVKQIPPFDQVSFDSFGAIFQILSEIAKIH
jgi:RNA-directed DNA polymerase